MTAGTFSPKPVSAPAQERLVLRPSLVVAGVLGFLTVMGVAAGLARFLIGLGGTTALTDSTSWGIWIGFDFGLIAFSGAAFTMAAVVHIFHLHRFEPVLRPALLAGLLGYSAVLVLLILDLGRPDHFYSFIIHWNLHSPLFEISWCVLLYTTVLVCEVAPDALDHLGWPRLRKFILWFMPIITIIGVTLSSLHQSTLGTLYLNMPHRISTLWWTPILPILFFTSAVMAGLSMGMIAYRAAVRIKGAEEDGRVLTGLAVGIAGVGAFYLMLRFGALIWNGSLHSLNWSQSQAWILLTEVVLLGVVPVVLCALPSMRRRSWVQWWAPILVLGGVLLNRFSATMFGQTAPIAGPAYVPSVLEWVSTIGIVAGATLAWYLGVLWLVDFNSPQHHAVNE
jgi:Ni/Fe-hydrogenase subunit HybB-like protein